MSETVKVRIAVGVSADGAWAAYAWGDASGVGFERSLARDVIDEMMGDHHLDAIRYIEADVPVPQPQTGETIHGEVTREEGTR